MSEDKKYIYYSTSKAQIHKISTENNSRSLLVSLPMGRKIQDFILFGNFIIVANDVGEIMAWQQNP